MYVFVCVGKLNEKGSVDGARKLSAKKFLLRMKENEIELENEWEREKKEMKLPTTTKTTTKAAAVANNV